LSSMGTLPEFQKPELIGQHSRDVMSRLWLTNFAENLPDLWELPTILDIIPKKERGPAIVIGRGPSLYEKGQLRILKEYQKKFTIFACDGTLCDCLRVGVLPDYVVSVDGNPFLILRYYGDWDFTLHYPNTSPHQIKQNTENIILVNEMARYIKCLLNALCHRNLFQRVKQAGFQIYTFQPMWDDPREWGISRVLGIMSASRKNPHGVPLIPTGGNCLSEDTLVYMYPYGVKAIRDVRIGDEVYCFNKERNCLTHQKCINVIDQGEKEVYEVRTRKKTIRATRDHLFLVFREKWTPLEKLKEGDRILTICDSPERFGLERIKSIRHVGVENVYDITVDKNHNFIADGFVVHNCGATALILSKILKHEVTALIGIDMGYPIDFPLSKTEYYNSMMVKIRGDLSQIPKYFKIYENPITGSRYYCDTVFNYYRLSLKRIIRDLKIKTVNCSDGTLFPDKGEDIPNLINMDFEEFLKRYD